MHAKEEGGLALPCANREGVIGLVIDKLTLAMQRDRTGQAGQEAGRPLGGFSLTQARKEVEGEERT